MDAKDPADHPSRPTIELGDWQNEPLTSATVAHSSWKHPLETSERRAPPPPPSQPPRPSYATVTRDRRRPTPTTSSASPSSPPLKFNETSRLHRTQILRRLPYNTTTRQIVSDITRQTGYTEDALFECVLRDPRDSRRFYLTYRTNALKTTVTRKGYYIKDLHIKPTDDTTSGYIPFPPYYIDQSTLDTLLQPYGRDVSGEFVKTKLGTRIAGYKFRLTLHKDTMPPTLLTYNGCEMAIKYDDDIKQCRYCGRYGHLIGQCRTKVSDDSTHQQYREEAAAQRTNEWKTQRHAVKADRREQRKQLLKQLNVDLAASADVCEASLIALEGPTISSSQADQLRATRDQDQDALQERHDDVLDLLEGEANLDLFTIDAAYRRAGGNLPSVTSGSPTPDDTPPCSRPLTAASSLMDLCDVAATEDRSARQLRDQLDQHTADPVPEVVVSPVPVVDKQPPAPPVLSTQPFRLQPPKVQVQRVASAWRALPPSFDYRLHCQYIIQLRTPTPHVTSLIRSHLFDLQMHHHLNPMATEICTATADDQSRLIYAESGSAANALMTFINDEPGPITCLEAPSCRTNPTYVKCETVA